MLKSTISADERDNYLSLPDAASLLSLSSYGLYASMGLIGFRLEYDDNQIEPLFHRDDIRIFKASIHHQVLSKIDLFTDNTYSLDYLELDQPDDVLAQVINRVQDKHMLQNHRAATWSTFKHLTGKEDDDLLTYAQAAIYLGNISLDELDEIVLTGKLFSKRLTDHTGTYWIFKKSWLEDYLAGIRSESKLKKLFRLIKALRSRKHSTTNR